LTGLVALEVTLGHHERVGRRARLLEAAARLLDQPLQATGVNRERTNDLVGIPGGMRRDGDLTATRFADQQRQHLPDAAIRGDLGRRLIATPGNSLRCADRYRHIVHRCRGRGRIDDSEWEIDPIADGHVKREFGFEVEGFHRIDRDRSGAKGTVPAEGVRCHAE